MVSSKNRTRLQILLVISVLGLLFLSGATAYYTFFRGEDLKDIVESQWSKQVTISARRGNILDADGEVIAQSASTQGVLVRPKTVNNAIKNGRTDLDTLTGNLAVILEMDESVIRARVTDETRTEVYLKRHISDSEARKIESLAYPGIAVFIETKRYYPFNDSLSQIIGYTNVDGEGQTGIEKQFDRYLSGQNGKRTVETDANGNAIEGTEMLITDAVDGNDVIMTVSSAVQSVTQVAAKDCMEGTDADEVVAMVMDPATCDILSAVILPSMDLNNIVRDDPALLNELSRNKAFQQTYDVGQAYGIFLAAAGLDSGEVGTGDTFVCNGYDVIEGELVKCWRDPDKHGEEGLFEVLRDNCGMGYVKIADKVGKEKFYDHLKRFGFGSTTGIDGVAETGGTVTDPKYVTGIELSRLANGIGIKATPLQMCTSFCSLINGGRLMKPRIIKEIRSSSGETVRAYDSEYLGKAVSEETSEKMRTILKKNAREGNASLAQPEGYDIGGYTGVSVTGDGVCRWFLGFAPAEDPKIAVLFLINSEDPDIDYSGSAAAYYSAALIEKTLRYMKTEQTGAGENFIEVPDIAGLTFAEAEQRLENAGFRIGYRFRSRLLGQFPAAGTKLRRGSTVYAVTADSETTDRYGLVPDITGKKLFEAIKEMKRNNIYIRVEGEVGDGVISTQYPEAGTPVEKGMIITVTCN